MATKPLSEFLKENTKQLHDAVEAKFESRKIFDKSYTLVDYKKIVWLNYLFHLHFENKTFESIKEETAKDLNLNERKKLHLLEKDLDSLGIEKVNAAEEVFVKNEAEAFGILYVMEGSTLGGNVIRKQLSVNPEFENRNFNYFGCYADKTGEFWKNFKDVLDSKFTENQYEEVLDGTKKAYKFMVESVTSNG